MKKLLAALVALVAINASAYDVTNTVTIVSNIYNRISEEHWITNNIKNTHTNYHYTNNVYTVSNVTLLVSQTNVHTTATYDMGRSMLSIMSNDVNSAKASIRSTADEAAGSASRASSSASSASSSAASAQNTLNNVNTRGAEIINGMNAKQAWFDQNYGKMITNHNIYVAEDQVARAGVAQNAADIASLEGRVGDNIQQLTTRMGTAETNIGNLNTSVSGLSSRIGAAEGNIQALKSSVTSVANLATNNQTAISAANGRIDDLDVILNCDVVPIVTQVVYRCTTIPAWTFRVRTDRFTMRGEEKCFEILDQVGMERNNRVSSYNWCPASWSYRTRIETIANGGGHGEVTYSLANDFLHEFTVVMHQLAADVYYSFEEIGRTFEPTDLGKKVPVRKADLFAGYWKPAESDFSNLTGVVKVATSDVRSRLDDVEARLDVRATEIANYSVSRSYVVWSFYYTYNGSLMVVKLKIYTDSPRLVSSDATSKTYEYDYEVVQSGSSLGWMDYVRKKCVTSAGNDSEVTVRLYESARGYSNLVCDGFSEGVSDFTGTHSVGSTVVTKSNRYYKYVFNEKMDDQTRTLVWTVNADLNIYDPNGTKIGRLMRDTDWSALSNWVERVFQKK